LKLSELTIVCPGRLDYVQPGGSPVKGLETLVDELASP
jgi:hypothetical protein